MTPFILTRKHFETPLGLVRTDRDLVERIAGACEWDPFEYEIAHRAEHSIEFQAVMLAHLFGEDIHIVPVLCSSVAAEDDPQAVARHLGLMSSFLSACRNVVAEGGDAVTVIAGADLAHVGVRFGDEFEVDDAVLAHIDARDEEDLAHVCAMDADAWYRSVMKDKNERRVCGLNCIHAALKSVEGIAQSGQLLHRGHAPDPAGGVVSFAAVALV